MSIDLNVSFSSECKLGGGGSKVGSVSKKTASQAIESYPAVPKVDGKSSLYPHRHF